MSSDRRYPKRPMIGVGAIIFTPDLTHVLLIKRGSPPAKGHWSFPSGLVEVGETLQKACKREVYEETGLHFDCRGMAVMLERIDRDPEEKVEYHFLIVDFWGIAPMEKIEPASDAEDAKWFLLSEVDRLLTTRGLSQAIERALQYAREHRHHQILLIDPDR